MIESPNHLPRLLKAKGRSMPRQKYQRPEVHLRGKRKKVWKGEWKEYYIDADGKQAYHHRSERWPQKTHTKADAQAKLDAKLNQMQQGGPKRDGTMSLSTFWNMVYVPIKLKRWGKNTREQNMCLWKHYIEPVLGSLKLVDIKRVDVEMMLVKAVETVQGDGTLKAIRSRLTTAMNYAMDNDFIPKNPCRKAELPTHRPEKETRAMEAEEVRRLWDRTEGTDYLIWRTLLLTGVRISELLALERTDLLPDGSLRIDESALDRKASTTKNRKTRIAPLPASLREELGACVASHQHRLIFPHPDGKMARYDDGHMQEMRDRARAAAEIPDLTFRMCRTTFATLFDGDIRDAQAILGHHSPAFTLQVYRKPISARQQKAVDELDSKLKVVPIREGVA